MVGVTTTNPARPPVPDGLEARLAVAARTLARLDGVPEALIDADPWLRDRPDAEIDGLEHRADGLGRYHQRSLVRAQRRSGGVFHTPVEVGRTLADLALDELGRSPRVVLDPAAGGGALLVASADALVARRQPPADAVRALHGVEIDPLAARVATSTLRRWAWRHGLGWPLDVAVEAGDAFAIDPSEPADLVIANPPFGGRLRGAATPAAPERVRAPLGAYADRSADFVALADELTAPDGVVASFAPSSLLGARDVSDLRAELRPRRRLAAVWVDPPPFDDVGIDPCAVVLGGPSGPTTVLAGGERSVVTEPGPNWSEAASAVPEPVELRTGGRLGEIAEVIAPFRDEYYALAAAVGDHGTGPPLITSGLIDPARSRWATAPTRVARRQYHRPRIDPAQVTGAGRRWIERQRRPKVLVASQTRRIEAIADPAGDLVAMTPVVAVIPHDGDPFPALAVLLSPVATVLVRRTGTGTGLSRRAVRIGGPLLGALPLPGDTATWRRAAQHLALSGESALVEVERMMGAAYGLAPEDPVLRWWNLHRTSLTPHRAQ